MSLNANRCLLFADDPSEASTIDCLLFETNEPSYLLRESDNCRVCLESFTAGVPLTLESEGGQDFLCIESTGQEFVTESDTEMMSPFSLPEGLLLLLDAELELTDGGGGAATAWADQSGNSNDFTAVGGEEPTINTSDLNSNDTITFDGTEKFTGPDIDSNLYTIICVFKPDSGQSSGGLLGEYNGSDPNRTFGIFITDLTPTFRIKPAVWTGSGSDSVANNLAIGPDADLDTWNVMSTTYNGGSPPSLPVRLNKLLLGELPHTGSGGTGNIFDANAAFTIGYLDDSVDRWYFGGIAYIAMWDRVLADDDILAVEEYLTSRYAL